MILFMVYEGVFFAYRLNVFPLPCLFAKWSLNWFRRVEFVGAPCAFERNLHGMHSIYVYCVCSDNAYNQKVPNASGNDNRNGLEKSSCILHSYDVDAIVCSSAFLCIICY